MGNTKIICTIVPDLYKSRENKRYSFSVFLTPRLSNSGTLKDYYEILHWDEFKEFFTKFPLQVRFGNLTGDKLQEDTIAATGIRYEANSNSQSQSAITGSRKIWQKLFSKNVPVSGWTSEESEAKRNPVMLFDINEIRKNATESQKEALKKLEDGSISYNEFMKGSPPKTNQQGQVPSPVVAGEPPLTDPSNRLNDLGRSNLGNNAYQQGPDTIKMNKHFKDLKANRMSEDEIRLRNKENQEFHKKMSALGEHPAIMRLTGWVIDYSIPDMIITGNANLIKLDFQKTIAKIRDDKDFKKWALFFNEIDFRTPWTSFSQPQPFDFSKGYSADVQYLGIENGFIKAGDGHITITSFDHKQLMAKIEESEQKITNVESVKNASDIQLYSTGIGINIRGIAKQVIDHSPDAMNSADANSKSSHQNDNIDNYVIFGHHLDAGYRIDVSPKLPDINGKPQYKFSSLCSRTADYGIDESPYSEQDKFTLLLKSITDEPWVAESIQHGKEDNYIDPELCRWNNWSLTCPHIGKYPQDEVVEDNREFNDMELRNIKPGQKLLPLRFGKEYFIRIRLADICGNGPCVEVENSNVTPISEYKRLEPINSPEIHLTERIFSIRKKGDQIYRRVKDGHYGEDLLTLVIRSTQHDLDNNKIVQETSRAISPSRVTPNFAEVHGAFDELLSNPNLSKRASSINQIFDRASYESENQYAEIFQPGGEIPYLTDPCVVGFSIQDLSSATSPVNVVVWPNGSINQVFSSINVNGGAGTRNNSTTLVGSQVQIEAKPGVITKYKVASLYNNNPFKYAATSIFVDQTDYKEQLEGASQQITVIHAVQKPVISEIGSPINLLKEWKMTGTLREREPGSNLQVDFSVLSDTTLPLSTSGEILLIATYHETVSDKTSKTGFTIKTNKKIVTKFSNIGEDHRLKTLDENSSATLLKTFNNLSHSFGDTKFRKIAYELEFVSRFKEFFPDESEFSVSAKIDSLILKSSKRPDDISIESIVPVMQWHENESTIERRNRLFRIYIEGDWYTTGASAKQVSGKWIPEGEEKIAVLFHEDSATISDDLKGLVSEIGKDPTAGVASKRLTKGINKELFASYQTDTSVNATLLTRMDPTIMDINSPTPADTTIVNAILLPVKFSHERKLFYCDVEFTGDIPDTYFPFIRLAIARFQENAIRTNQYDFRFSKVTTAPVTFMLPFRKFNLSKSAWPSIPSNTNLNSNYNAKKLEFYIILESQICEEFNTLVTNHSVNDSTRAIRIDKLNSGQLTFLSDNEIATQVSGFKYDRAFLEEYEKYEVMDGFIINEKTNYNPRNDIRKRLVFSYLL